LAADGRLELGQSARLAKVMGEKRLTGTILTFGRDHKEKCSSLIKLVQTHWSRSQLFEGHYKIFELTLSITVAYTNQSFSDKVPTLPEVLEVLWQRIKPMTGKNIKQRALCLLSDIRIGVNKVITFIAEVILTVSSLTYLIVLIRWI
jgi:hypothetical protein